MVAATIHITPASRLPVLFLKILSLILCMCMSAGHMRMSAGTRGGSEVVCVAWGGVMETELQSPVRAV